MTARHRLGDLPAFGPAAIAIGVFDGVHRGHQALVEAVALVAGGLGTGGVTVIIDPHPDEVLGSSDPAPRLTSLTRTAELLASRGSVNVVVVEFDRGVAALAPDEFLAALSPGIDVRAVVMTEESRFGRARSGTPERVRAIGEERGFELVIVPLVQVDGIRVSSTLVREAVRRGDLARAEELMGRPHAVEGVTRERNGAHGTAELVLEPAYRAALPRPGEYAATATPTGPPGAESQPLAVRVEHGGIVLDRANTALGDGQQVRIAFASSPPRMG